MAYVTEEQIYARVPASKLISLTQEDKSQLTADSKRIQAAVFDASAIIDEYCGVRYSVPLSPVPDIIVRLTIDITMYFLYKNRYDNAMPEEIGTAYKSALDTLQEIKEFRSSLIGVELKEGFGFKILTNTNRVYTNELIKLI